MKLQLAKSRTAETLKYLLPPTTTNQLQDARKHQLVVGFPHCCGMPHHYNPDLPFWPYFQL